MSIRKKDLATALLLSLTGASLLSTGTSHALTLDMRFVGNNAQPASLNGGGNLQEIVEAAATTWENVYADEHTITINYGWDESLPPNVWGQNLSIIREGTPTRQVFGSIGFNPNTTWFADPTPFDASEFTSYDEPGNMAFLSPDNARFDMNAGRRYSGGQGDAQHVDLYTIALHEIGHSLGFTGASTFLDELDQDSPSPAFRVLTIDDPLPYAGTEILVENLEAHLYDPAYPAALMRGTMPIGTRLLPSELDILINAQTGSFSQVNLNPIIPEPSSALLAILPLCFGLLIRRRAHPLTE